MKKNKERLPDFIIIGAAKSGTTSLYDYLTIFDDIFLSDPKEPCFFDEDVSWRKGLGWYKSLFQEAMDSQICGEASTNYTQWPQVKNVPEKMKKVIPNAKLIYLVRNPVDRAYSHFVHRWTKELHPGKPFTQSFSDYIRSDPMCIDSSQYYIQIEKYLSVFEKNKICVIMFENLIKNPTKELTRLLHFLGLNSEHIRDFSLPLSNKNKNFRYHQVRNIVIAKLKEFPYMNSITKLIPLKYKEHFYDKLVLNLKIVKKLKSSYEPPKLTERERANLRLLFKESNRKFSDKWNVDVSHWT